MNEMKKIESILKFLPYCMNDKYCFLVSLTMGRSCPVCQSGDCHDYQKYMFLYKMM